MKIELLKVNGRFELLRSSKFLDEELDSKSWEKYFSTNEFDSDKAEKFIRNIGEMRLVGSDAESEYLVVDSSKKISDKNEYETIKRNIAIKVENIFNNGTDGFFLGQGDPIKGIYNNDTRIFTEK